MPDDKPVEEVPIENMSLPALFAMQTVAAEQLVAATGRVSAVKAELGRRFGESIKRALTEDAKTHGTKSLPLQDGLVAKGEVKRTTKWDSPALQAVAQTLPWERVVAIFKIEFSVPEAIYKGIKAAAPELADKISAARTDTFSEPAVAIAKAS